MEDGSIRVSTGRYGISDNMDTNTSVDDISITDRSASADVCEFTQSRNVTFPQIGVASNIPDITRKTSDDITVASIVDVVPGEADMIRSDNSSTTTDVGIYDKDCNETENKALIKSDVNNLSNSMASRIINEFNLEMKRTQFDSYSALRLRAGEFLRFSSLTLTPGKVRQWKLISHRRVPSAAAANQNSNSLVLTQPQWTAVPDSEDQQLLKNIETLAAAGGAHGKHTLLHIGHLKTTGALTGTTGTFRRSHRSTKAQQQITDAGRVTSDSKSYINGSNKSAASGSSSISCRSGRYTSPTNVTTIIDNDRTSNVSGGRTRRRVPTPFRIFEIDEKTIS